MSDSNGYIYVESKNKQQNLKRCYNFKDDLEFSKKTEKIFADYLKRIGVHEIYLAPDKEVFEDWDICAAGMSYEIKRDRYMQTTGNFCIETFSHKEKGSLGWFIKSKADTIVVFYNETDFVFISMEDLRDAWFDNPKIWTKKEIKQTWGTTIVWLAKCNMIPNLRTGSTA